MYAAVVRLTIETKRAPAAAATFSTDILPRVTAAAGFVGGYWLDPVDELVQHGDTQITKVLAEFSSLLNRAPS
jgi:hypothetical protein